MSVLTFKTPFLVRLSTDAVLYIFFNIGFYFSSWMLLTNHSNKKKLLQANETGKLVHKIINNNPSMPHIENVSIFILKYCFTNAIAFDYLWNKEKLCMCTYAYLSER